MPERISGTEHPLKDIFSSKFEYVIPFYQRPYAWTIDETSQLFDDLYDSYKSEDEENYFIGSIVLIKEEGIPRAEVIDGQQRLTTLTMLLAAITARLDPAGQKDFKDYLIEPGRGSQGLDEKPRLFLREKDHGFFNKYVQRLDLKTLFEKNDSQLENEPQRNIKNNTLEFSKKLSEKFEDNQEKLLKFGSFIVQKCYLVVVSTPSQHSAIRIFSVMNSRGLDLQATDIIKAEILKKLTSEEDSDAYSKRWEDLEDMLGRDGFNALFTYVRMIYAKDKAQKVLSEEFQKHVLKKELDPKRLIKDVLEPYADAFNIVRTSDYKATSHAKEVNDNLRWLNQIDNADWTPVAILFLKKYGNKPEYIDWFFNSLERLAAYMMVCKLNINERIKRYSEVIKSIEQLDEEHNPMEFQGLEKTIELIDEEKSEMRKWLASDVYEMSPKRCKYIILRLDSFVSDRAASYDSKVLSIEHVLPQTVNSGSEWAEWWPDEKAREKWLHKIGNLVPLNRRKNKQALNYNFSKKKSKYFVSDNNVSSYALTTQVVSCEQWKEEDVEKRQQMLLEVFKKKWRL